MSLHYKSRNNLGKVSNYIEKKLKLMQSNVRYVKCVNHRQCQQRNLQAFCFSEEQLKITTLEFIL